MNHIIIISLYSTIILKNNFLPAISDLKFDIIPNKGTMLKGSWVDAAPNIVYPLVEKNVFILGVTYVEIKNLKMVKIRVTGKDTFDWLEARYKKGYPEECEKQSTFNENCFEGSSVEQDKYDVDLIATVAESKGITQGFF